jgi:hypothetical protein
MPEAGSIVKNKANFVSYRYYNMEHYYRTFPVTNDTLFFKTLHGCLFRKNEQWQIKNFTFKTPEKEEQRLETLHKTSLRFRHL